MLCLNQSSWGLSRAIPILQLGKLRPQRQVDCQSVQKLDLEQAHVFLNLQFFPLPMTLMDREVLAGLADLEGAPPVQAAIAKAGACFFPS